MKLTKTVFLSEWERLARRFNRKLDEASLAEAEDYFRFLSHRMSAGDFLTASHTVWATAKWFPRPSDFLTTNAAQEWRVVLSMAQDGYDKDTWGALSQSARHSTEACGGLTGMGASVNVMRLRDAWMDAYEREVQSLVGELFIQEALKEIEEEKLLLGEG